jgi:hypothetical protein
MSRAECRARPVPARQPGRAHHPLRLSPVPVPHRPQLPARPLPVVDTQGRHQDRHPHAQPHPARAIPSPVRQHQAPSRADQRTRDTLSRDGRAGRRMDNTIRGHLRRLQRLQRRHTPDNVSSPRPESRGPYSEDTQIRTPDNRGYLRARPRAVVTRSGRGGRPQPFGCRRRPSRGGGDAITRDPSTACIRLIRADGSQAYSPRLRADDAHRAPPIALPDFTMSSHIRVARGWLIRTTGRLRPGRSWHNCRCSRDRGITGNSRRDPLNTSSRMRHCQEFPGTQAQPQPAFRDPAGAP